MAVKIRMQRRGSKKRPFYYIVVANSASKRDGKFIEKLGTYNPLTVPATVELNRESALNWLEKGAQPSNTVKRILSFKGVLYMKHLNRGVRLNVISQEEADKRLAKWDEEHQSTLSERTAAEKQAIRDKKSSIAEEAAKRVEEKNAARRAELEAQLKEAEEAAAAEANEEANSEETNSEEANSEENTEE